MRRFLQIKFKFYMVHLRVWFNFDCSLLIIALHSCGAVHMSRASPANRADSIPLPLMGA